MSRESCFEAKDVTVRYGGVIANDAISIEIGRGEIVGLIGPNGAGKTTFIDAVTGFTSASGTVAVDGRPVHDLPPHARRRAGLARTWQAGELFSSLTVRANVQVAAEAAGWLAVLRDLARRRRPAGDVDAVLAEVGLGDLADSPAEDLSLGHQKLLGVARALVGRPVAVLLDEPAAGLDTRESQALAGRLRSIADRGPGMLIVDHDMSLIMGLCDRVYVLDFGHLIVSGTPVAVRADERVLAAYLGASKEVAE